MEKGYGPLTTVRFPRSGNESPFFHGRGCPEPGLTASLALVFGRALQTRVNSETQTATGGFRPQSFLIYGKLLLCHRPPALSTGRHALHSPSFASLAFVWAAAKSACLLNWNDK